MSKWFSRADSIKYIAETILVLTGPINWVKTCVAGDEDVQFGYCLVTFPSLFTGIHMRLFFFG